MTLNARHEVKKTKAFVGVQGAVFSKRAPWPPEAKKRNFYATVF
jgi:hypothetical protein